MFIAAAIPGDTNWRQGAFINYSNGLLQSVGDGEIYGKLTP